MNDDSWAGMMKGKDKKKMEQAIEEFPVKVAEITKDMPQDQKDTAFYFLKDMQNTTDVAFNTFLENKGAYMEKVQEEALADLVKFKEQLIALSQKLGKKDNK